MSDETFRPRRPTNPSEQHFSNVPPNHPLSNEHDVRSDDPNLSQGAFKIQGNAPPEFIQALNSVKGNPEPQQYTHPQQHAHPQQPIPQASMRNAAPSRSQNSSHLRELLENLKGSTSTYEEIQLPSKGKFYNGTDGPTDGIISLRPMTGEEEQILATPRFVRKGQAINMIFQKCMKEQYRVDQFLTVDRTYILIYLRGISYSPEYEVELKCPECDRRFNHTVDLNSLFVEGCPEDFGPVLSDVLPNTKLPFTYRISRGRDEQEISDYREQRIRIYGDNAVDDTLVYRTAHLLTNIDGITDKEELKILLKNLPINDVSYIRNLINDPPFGVETNIEINCSNCLEDFTIELPLESNFFFPRRKKVKTPV